MRILILNPNSTESMTRDIAEAAQEVAGGDTLITAKNPTDAPAAIQGPEDGAAALAPLNRLFDDEVTLDGGYDAAIIACFDDTGLWELRRRSPIPVIGIGEAGYMLAALRSERFWVITTLSVSVPVLEDNLRRYGFGERCRGVLASEIPVLAIDADPQAAEDRIVSLAQDALGKAPAESVVLGCAGMAMLRTKIEQRLGVPVIDGVAAAVRLCEALR